MLYNIFCFDVLLLVDKQTAVELLPTMTQHVGMSLTTDGLDPSEKYSFPQTTNQFIGWKARDIDNIEIFGVAGNQKKKSDVTHPELFHDGEMITN